MKKILLFSAFVITTSGAFGQTVKKVVCEEKTGTWCQYCPYGTVAMANLDADEPNAIGIAIHDSDPMENSYYNTESDDFPDFGGYPYACADRAETGGSGSSVGHAYYVDEAFAEREDFVPAASVSVGANYVASTDKIMVTVGATFDSDESGDWRLAAVLIEDNVTGSTSGYAQSNAFAGGGMGAFSGAGHDWHTEPNPVPAASMEYDHVAREVANDEISGDAGSLPASTTTGSTYYYSYEIDMDASWDLANLHIVGMLIEPDGSINNAESSDVTTATNSIDEVVANHEMKVFPNPATTEVSVKVSTVETSDVTVELYNMMGAVIYTESTQNLAAGDYYYNYDVAGIAAGIYTVKTTVNGSVKTAKLSVK